MAQQHTTPEKSLAAAYAAEERAQHAGRESRLKKDSCYELYEASLRCLDQHNYDRGACEDAFADFKACRLGQKTSKAGGGSTFEGMLKAQEQDPLFGSLLWLFGKLQQAVGDAVSAATTQPQPQPEPEPEWKVAKRQREEQQRLEQQMQEWQAVMQQQQEQQQQQQQRQQGVGGDGLGHENRRSEGVVGVSGCAFQPLLNAQRSGREVRGTNPGVPPP